MLSNYFCSNHAWVSYIGFTEAYNDATENVSPMSEINIPKSPGEYITLSTRYRLQFAIVCSYFVTFIYSDLCLQFSDTSCLLLDRRITSSAFIMHELEEECRDRNLQWSFMGTKEEAIDNLMGKIEKLRSSELYVHNKEDCSELCKKRGE